MNRVTVASTLLASVSYEPAEDWLEVKFRSGEIYRYFNVPLSIYHCLLMAVSKGRYFNAHIRNSFPYKQIYSPQRTSASTG